VLCLVLAWWGWWESVGSVIEEAAPVKSKTPPGNKTG
jgi:hypothetical protein